MTVKTVFTDRYLAALKPAPAGQRYNLWDGRLEGLGVRVTDTGAATFIVMKRLPGQKTPTRITIGRYPAVSLAKARTLAAEAISDLSEGNHPREKKRAQQEAAARETLHSVAHVAERFLTEHADHKRTGRAIRQLIENRIVAAWGKRPMASIQKGDITQLIANIRNDVKRRRATDGAEQARQTLIFVKSLFSWAAEMDLIDSNPAAMIKANRILPPKRARERTLTDAEIAAIWRATESVSVFSPYVRLLLILGCRRAELAKMQRSELDLDAGEWRLTGDRTKNVEPRTVFLPKMAVEILRAMPEHTGSFVFSTTAGLRPISGFEKMKKRIDKLAGVEGWNLHDLRRTMRTGLSTLQVPFGVAELAIGHKQRGVSAIYDRHRYEHELRDALEKWCARLRDITEPAPPNLLRMPQRVVL